MPASAITLLRLEPENTLVFKGTASAPSPSRTLKLTNIHSGHVAFKVKTTAPKSYLVRPSSGTIARGETQEVQIVLQQQTNEGQANSHRFLVQCIGVGGADTISREQWADFQKSKDVQEQRLNVVLEESDAPSGGGAPAPAQSGGAAGASGLTTESAKGGGSSGDLESKYEELVQYTLSLEKSKKKLEQDLLSLQGTKGGQSGGYSAMHMFLVAFIVFMISFATKYVM
eukprot:TRINITY_DN37511_c0_g1_i1.p1 TRINITY_DN37511_c0_g1~~TRINITY_DN37511_c0_g1_i1.p1  ORF type:complete len:228 (-),score=59.20 TRINITY_DN37511_c0_g1_i1:116-799(-)